MITLPELRRIMPNLAAAKAARYLPLLQQAMREFGITGRLRGAAFVAQLAHESGELKYFQELASGGAYEGRADLGNTQRGDGKRFKGRGPIQITGRTNYERYGRLLGLDLVGHPEWAAVPEHGFRIAALYWAKHDLNVRADRREFRAITHAINGGYNALADRQRYYRVALAVLDDEADRGAITVVVDDQELEISGYQDAAGAAWVPLRRTCEALGAVIGALMDGRATLKRDGVECSVPFATSAASVGFVPAADLAAGLALRKQWDPENRTVLLEDPA